MVSTAATRASSMETTCVPMRMARLSRLSASAPPNTESAKTGICPANPSVPRARLEPLNRYTSHAWAMDCIQVPSSDTACPAKNSR